MNNIVKNGKVIIRIISKISRKETYLLKDSFLVRPNNIIVQNIKDCS